MSFAGNDKINKSQIQTHQKKSLSLCFHRNGSDKRHYAWSQLQRPKYIEHCH